MTGLGGIVISIFLVVIAWCLIGLNALMAVRMHRWVILRVRKALARPEAEILQPSIVWKVFERGLHAPREKSKSRERASKFGTGQRKTP
jgi:hypothetical protein